MNSGAIGGGEMPTLVGYSATTTSSYDPGNWNFVNVAGGQAAAGQTFQQANYANSAVAARTLDYLASPAKPNPMEEPMADKARIVKVFIVDPNANLPLELRILWHGDEKLTELTDQELFFEIPIRELLDKHNAVRAKTQNKQATEKFGREIFMEPVRIKDLKMVVSTIAEF